MSYDLEFFQLREGVAVDEINAFIASDDYDVFERETDAREEHGDDVPLLPERFFNDAISREELERLIAKAYIEVLFPPDERSVEVRQYLDSDGRGNVPDEFAEELMDLFEWDGPAGTLPVCLGFGPLLVASLDRVADMLKVLAPRRIVVLDPQIGAVVDAASARALFRESAAHANAVHQEILRKIKSGELPDTDDEDDNE